MSFGDVLEPRGDGSRGTGDGVITNGPPYEDLEDESDY